MKPEFRIGTHYFHEEPNMNYTFNRVYSVNGGDLVEIREASKRIKTLEDWSREFIGLAEKARSEGRLLNAAAYYRGANFYLHPDDPRKTMTYETYLSLIHDIYREDFETGMIKELKVPFAGGFLPVWHAGPAAAGERRNVVVMHLGNDSIKEELVPLVHFFREAGLELFLFEGPGQGEALYRYGIHMIPEWEKPVKAVLDHFNLDDITLIGLSLGGYLAPRAAAFEPRVSRVIAWGVMYDFFDVVVSRRGKFLEMLLKSLLAIRASVLVNGIIRLKMKKDTYTRWGLEHGMFLMDAKDPYGYFKKIIRFSMKKISHLVSQDFLLIGSTHDHFIPAGHFGLQISKLVNTRSLTGRIFTRSEHAENHVSFGNTTLVLRYIISWIREHTALMENDDKADPEFFHQAG
ncbi:MAG TPA: alpha/beta hydrolase [Spirochaetota bacterium]|nr:alpha/beta hydrolase [Spirochaetota bacterium]